MFPTFVVQFLNFHHLDFHVRSAERSVLFRTVSTVKYDTLCNYVSLKYITLNLVTYNRAT